MPSTIFERPVALRIARYAGMLIACCLLLLTIYQFQHRNDIMLKLGMTHFFSPGLTGILPWCLIALTLMGGLALLLWDHPAAAWPALLVFSLYTLYNIVLYIKTGDSCGCSNIFFEMDLPLQIGIGVLNIALTVFVNRTLQQQRRLQRLS